MTVNDAKFEALRAQGYTGAMPDMVLQWLHANGATANCISDAWLEMLASQGITYGGISDRWFNYLGSLGFDGNVSDRQIAFWASGGVIPANLYTNPALAGGPPPTNHAFIFETTDFAMGAIGDGRFAYVSNPSETASVRHVMAYQLEANNPLLDVGKTYRLSYQCLKVNTGTYSAALVLTGTNNLTVLGQSTAAAFNETRTLFIDFRIDDPAYTGIARVGCGTTANNSAHLVYDNPRLVELP